MGLYRDWVQTVTWFGYIMFVIMMITAALAFLSIFGILSTPHELFLILLTIEGLITLPFACWVRMQYHYERKRK
jgi:hypothetical protein